MCTLVHFTSTMEYRPSFGRVLFPQLPLSGTSQEKKARFCGGVCRTLRIEFVVAVHIELFEEIESSIAW
jgi:hypothetical protein